MLKRRLRRCEYDFQLENKEVKRLKERRRNKFNKLENEFCFVPAKAADFQRKAARLLKSEACARPVCKCWNTFSSSEKDLGDPSCRLHERAFAKGFRLGLHGHYQFKRKEVVKISNM